MHGHHRAVQPQRRADAAGDRVRNVMKFEVEKNLVAAIGNTLHAVRPVGRKEFFPELDGADFAGQQVRQHQRVIQLRGIDGAEDTVDRRYFSHALALGIGHERLIDDFPH